MFQELITESEYDTLPVETQRRFLTLEKICRKNLLDAISGESGEYYDDLIRIQYMTIVTAAAEELGIQGIYAVDTFSSVDKNIQEFFRLVGGVVAKLRLRTSLANDMLSVKLANKTKGIIEAELSKLRDTVSESDLEEKKKARLLEKIEDFRTELHKDRLRFGPAMAILVTVSASLTGGTAFLADAPQAVSTIMKLIGEDKAAEDTELMRLEGPKPQQFITSQNTSTRDEQSTEMNEDIPF